MHVDGVVAHGDVRTFVEPGQEGVFFVEHALTARHMRDDFVGREAEQSEEEVFLLSSVARFSDEQVDVVVSEQDVEGVFVSRLIGREQVERFVGFASFVQGDDFVAVASCDESIGRVSADDVAFAIVGAFVPIDERRRTAEACAEFWYGVSDARDFIAQRVDGRRSRIGIDGRSIDDEREAVAQVAKLNESGVFFGVFRV